MAKGISVLLMFDEASDIQMNQHLNVFVNVLLDTGEVKTLTLALQGCNLILFFQILHYTRILCNSPVGKLVAAHGYRQKRENKLEIKK